MSGEQINRVSSKTLIVLSLIALITVLSGYTQPPQPDEGTAAHIFSAVNRGSGADGFAFLRNGELEPAYAKRAAIGISSRSIASGIWSAVLP
jgi:hypothetical protein